MTFPVYSWPLSESFLNRVDERSRLEAWWDDPSPEPIVLIGRRRVGKSWLFRRFAHGKPAVVLVAEQLPAHSQLNRFADVLEPILGVRPHLPDVQALLRVLFRMAREHKVLAILDEFPWLLGATATEVRHTLTSIQAVMEDERDQSLLKLVLCGSHVAQMESLFAERSPLHGRLQQLQIRPLEFAEARSFLGDLAPIDAFERFAVSGGMPMCLSRLAAGSLRHAVCRSVLHRDSPLFDEGRRIVDQELREPRLYFAILEQLATGAKASNEIAQRVSVDSASVHKYLLNLEALRLVSRRSPLGAAPTSRSGRWWLDDSFLRFWFRFVFPFQSDLESGLAPTALFDAEVAGDIADHVSPVFETWCLHWMRSTGTAGATRVGRWWGNAADEFRRTKERSSEEIDAVGTLRNRVVVVGEAKWTSTPVGVSVVDDLERFKIPALRKEMRVVSRPHVVLFSKAGYTPALVDRARSEPHITLVDVAAELGRSWR